MWTARCGICFLLAIVVVVRGEIRPFHGHLEAASFFVHFTAGYVDTPGLVDLSDLEFQVAIPNRNGQDATADLVLFREPDSCAHARRGCDWTQQGIGYEDPFGDLVWCCTQAALKSGICTDAQLNRLILKEDDPSIGHLSLNIPGKGKDNTVLKLDHAVFDLSDTTKYKSGKYVLLMANCNDNGRTVKVDGSYAYKSAHGYLPGDQFGEYYYFFVVFVAYVILAGWYAWLYKEHLESQIPIQKWVFGTILLGLLEALFRCMDYMIWNASGTRHPFVLYTAIIVGAFKHTLARCLLVMVSLGWGVVCNTLGRNYWRLLVLAAVYSSLGIALDIVSIVAVNQIIQLGGAMTDLRLLEAEAILGLILIGLNILFLVWIFAGMARTMTYLKNTQQDVKLERYRQLRLLLLFFAVFAIVWFFLMRTEILYQFLPTSQAWVVQTLMEVDYLAMITGVAILWRPSPNARDYAYELQLGSEEDVNELELTEEIPSAMADDDEEEGDYAALPVEQGVKT